LDVTWNSYSVSTQQKPGKSGDRSGPVDDSSGLHWLASTEKLRPGLLKRYLVQCGLATAVVLVLLLVMDTVTQTVLIAALGASTFIAFAVPRSMQSSPRHLIGGYLVGTLVGSLMSMLHTMVDWATLMDPHAGLIVFGALSIGLTMFLMVVTATEHPPAAALALGIVLNEWDLMTLVVVMAGAVALSIVKQLILPMLMDLG
jgi:CBS-domain-containing membrane protein